MRLTVLAALLTAAMTACAAPPTPSAARVPASPDQAALRLQEAVGEPLCQADAQCRAVGVGQKACGGPQGYLAYSTEGGREPAILAAAQALKDAQTADNRASGRVSDCMMLLDPGAQCVAGRCQLRRAGPGGMPAVAQ